MCETDAYHVGLCRRYHISLESVCQRSVSKVLGRTAEVHTQERAFNKALVKVNKVAVEHLAAVGRVEELRSDGQHGCLCFWSERADLQYRL